MVAKEISFKVDGKTLKTKQGESILKACYAAYIDIPRFCYHEGLRIAGNCRMCLVEVANSRKLIASCATPLVSSFSVFTKTFRVKKARQAVLEFLLINHPLDCPICDQGGECDLQDITLIFGGDRGRFYEISKRAVFDKNLGPLIKTIMNRCIHCTRCVRFFQETSFLETERLGLLGRGSAMEIGTYIPNFMLSELSGNVIDLCPVGALTSKPFAFKARSWELYSQYTYDIVDSFMPRVKFDLVGKNILRVLPYMGVYQFGWINNRTRFCYDSLNLQRQESCIWNFSDKIKLLNLYNNRSVYINITWQDAFSVFSKYILKTLKGLLKARVSSLISLDNAWQVKQFFTSMGCQKIVFEDYCVTNSNMDFRCLFAFDMPLDLFDKNLWQVFLVNVNLRMEAPILYLQLKKLQAKGAVSFFTIGSGFFRKDNINIQNGISLNSFIKLLECRSSMVRLFLKHAAFYKFLILMNLELVHNNIKGIFNFFRLLIEGDINNVFKLNSKVFFNDESNIIFSVLQRYVGHISYAELALSNSSSLVLNDIVNSNLNSSTNIFFDTSAGTNVKLKHCLKETNNLSNNVLFNSSNFDISSFNGFFNLILPVKGFYDTEGVYMDVFLKKKKSSLIVPAMTTHKNLVEVLTALSIYMRLTLNFSWLISFFSSLFLNVRQSTHELLFDNIISGENNGTFWLNFYKIKAFYKTNVLFLFSCLFINREFIFSENKNKFIFVKINTIKILPSLNFYHDHRLNLLNFSKSMKQSSLAYEQSRIDLTFGL